MPQCINILILVLICLSPNVHAHCNFPQQEEVINLWDCTTYLIDSTQSLTLNQIPNATFADADSTLKFKNNINLWLKWNTTAPNASHRYQLNIDRSGKVVVYAKQLTTYQRLAQNGFLVAPADRTDQPFHHQIVFEVPPGTTSLLIQMEQFNTYNRPITIYPLLKSFQPTVHQRSQVFLYGISLGAILAFLLYPLSLLGLEGQNYYKYYIAYIVFSFLYCLLDTEQYMGVDFLFSYFPWSFKYCTSIFSTTSILFYILFFKYFVRLKIRLPALNQVINLTIVVLIFSIIADVFFHFIGYSTFAFYQSLAIRVCSLFVGIYSIWRVSSLKNRQVNYIILGTTSWLLGTVIFILSTIFLVKGYGSNQYLTFTAQFFLQVGTIIELCFFSLALSYDRRLYYQDKIRAEEKVVNAQRLQEQQSRLFNSITHEFRTPLTLINGMIERLKKRSRGNEKELAVLERNSKQLLTLVNQMLDSARIENGQWAVQKEAVEIVSFLNYLVDSFKSLAIEKEIALAFFAAQMTAMNVLTDRDKLQKIISNLLSNALKYCPQYGEIKVILKHDQDANQLVISVSDSGAGIKKEEVARLFERFYQSKNGNAQTGSGIGLSLTAELVKLLGGSIEAMPKTDSQLFQMMVKLPIQAVPSVTPDHSFVPITLQPNTDQRTLLIVEDNREVRQYLHSIVQPHYQILVAMNGQEGVEMATAEVPDLIISDVMMPRMDGYALCEQLKSDNRTSHIPIVLLTAKTSVENRVTGLNAGADAYLAKPFHEAELLTRLEQLVANQRRLQQYFQESLTTPIALKLNPQEQLEQDFMHRLNEVIQSRLSDGDFSIPELCQLMTMSKTQLYRKVKALTGKSVALYIRSLRLHQARQILRNTEQSVGEISEQIGISDLSYFARVYKQEFGLSPSDDRTP